MFNLKLKNLRLLNQMIIFKSKFYFFKIQRKNLKIFKYFDDRRIGSIPRIFLTSIFVIFSFYSVPAIISFTDKQRLNNKEFQNNSKAILAYTLNKKNNGTSADENLNEKDLLIDIFSLNDLETDTVYRSDGSTGYKEFPRGPGSVKVIYKGGYATCPADLKLAVIDLISYYHKDEHKQRQTLSGASIQNQGTSGQSGNVGFPDHIKRILDLYKNF